MGTEVTGGGRLPFLDEVVAGSQKLTNHVDVKRNITLSVGELFTCLATAATSSKQVSEQSISISLDSKPNSSIELIDMIQQITNHLTLNPTLAHLSITQNHLPNRYKTGHSLESTLNQHDQIQSNNNNNSNNSTNNSSNNSSNNSTLIPSDWIVPKTFENSIQLLHATVQHGSKIAVALPKTSNSKSSSQNLKWNGKALLLAHGHRSDDEESLVADLDPQEPFIKRLIKSGWLVGMTSYRRNGRIIKQATEDMNILRQWIEDNIGPIQCCVVEGRSMGGKIVTHLMELYPELYMGAVAIGAALLTKDEKEYESLEWSYQPARPILYLTNQSELGPIQDYVSKVQKRTAADSVKKTEQVEVVLPAIWEVWREGHNLVSSKERGSALENLMEWIEYSTFITARTKNVLWREKGKLSRDQPVVQIKKSVKTKTVTNAIKKTTLVKDVEVKEGHGVVVSVHPVHDSFVISFEPEDMERLGIRQGKWFVMECGEEGGQKLDVMYGSYPFFVEVGSFVAWDNPDGFISVSILSWVDKYYSATVAKVTRGSPVSVYSL